MLSVPFAEFIGANLCLSNALLLVALKKKKISQKEVYVNRTHPTMIGIKQNVSPMNNIIPLEYTPTNAGIEMIHGPSRNVKT